VPARAERLLPSGRMSEDPRDAQIATIRRVMEAFNRRDVETALACATDDVELRLAGTGALTGRDCYRGHDGIREYFEDVARVWPDGLQVEPVDYRAVAGSVVVFGGCAGSPAESAVLRRHLGLAAARRPDRDRPGIPD